MESDTGLTLVGTKLTAPTPPSPLVRRPHLDQALQAAVDDPAVRLILVSAPAGSGKSTLVTSWRETAEIASAWLQIDAADQDPARFWTHVIAALAARLPDLEAEVAGTLPGSAMDARPLVELLANQLTAAGEPIVLVVDDYHLVSNPAIDQGIESLVELAPDSFTLIVCSRVDPSIRLSKLRVGGRLVEIRGDDLRFESAEAAELLAQDDRTPLPHHTAALCDRTEGWAAGLVLAGMSLAASPDADAFVAAFQGDDRLVVDYLTEEFLSGVSAADRERLLWTSILDGLSGPLVDAVCGTSDGTAWLRELAATNQLVIGLDRTATSFRYHHLLGDVLRMEAQYSLAAADLADLHRRAGHWLQRHGRPLEAVEHFIRSGDHAEAADLIYDEATELLNSGQLATLRRQIADLGPLADHHVGTAVVNGFLALFLGRMADARHYLDLARSLGPDDDQLRLTTALAIYLAISSGDVASALREAEASAPPTESAQALSLIWARTWAGDFDGATPLLALAERISNVEKNVLVAVAVPIYEALIAVETGRPADARRAAERALELAAAKGLAETTNVALAHSIIGRTSEDPDEAAAAADRGMELGGESASALSSSYTIASAADVRSRHGQADGDDLLRKARRIIDPCPDPGIVGRYLSQLEARQGVLPTAESPGLVENLTDREQAVLQYLPSQLTQRDIANELYVSLNTVRTHCKSIYRKLGVGDRKAAVQAARDHGLL